MKARKKRQKRGAAAAKKTPVRKLARPVTQAPLPPSVQGVSADELSRLAAAFESGICVLVTVGELGVRRKLSAGEIKVTAPDSGDDVGAEDSMLRVSKIILDCDEYRAVQRRSRSIKAVLLRYGMQTILHRSLYLIPVSTYERAMRALDDEIAAHGRDVAAFMAKYDEIKLDAKRRLGTLYNDSDYPAPERVRASFYVRVRRGFRVAVDDKLKAYDPAAYEAALREEQADRAAAVAEFRAGLRATLCELVAHLADRLSGRTTDGRPRVLRTAAVENVTEFLSMFDSKNVAQDDALRRQVETMHALLRGVVVEDVKDDQAFRDALGAKVAAVGQVLATLTQDAPTRKMRLTPKKEAAA